MPSRVVAALCGLAALLWSAALPAQITCAGDCDDDGRVAIGEVVRCVRTLLQMPVESCARCDADGDEVISVADLIQAVQRLLGGCGGIPTPTATPPTACGDRVVAGSETCDDGNTVGGDGCAANCTAETRRLARFDSLRTTARVQSAALPIALALKGSQLLTTGRGRAETVRDVAGNVLFRAGDVPLVIRVDDLDFEPVRVPGLRCACVRGVEVPELGSGNAASGVIACGTPLVDLDLEVAQDHNTTPGDPGNAGPDLGHPDDAQCNARVTAPNFPLPSEACLEGSGAECSSPLSYHLDVCNGPRRLTYDGGMAPRGAALVSARIAIGLLEDAGQCHTTPPRNGDNSCAVEDYGPDCLPCTDDDLDLGIPQTIPLTTQTASAVVFDVNNNPGEIIAPGADCRSPCEASASGAVFDCAALEASADHALSGSALAGCFPVLDSATLGDNVVCAVLASE